MKKNLIIIILAIVTVFSMLYAFIKADEADKEQAMAVVAQEKALTEKERADELADLAAKRAAEAIVAQSEAERLSKELKECQSK